MLTWSLGTLGFVLYFIYDWNSVRFQNWILQKCFGAGSLLTALATVLQTWQDFSTWKEHLLWKLVLAAGAVLFLCLLLYTLFFALPFKETYVEDSAGRAAYTQGVYGLCRHPGVLWFAGLYLCLMGIWGTQSGSIFSLSMIAWNLLYILFQDVWTFPKTFTNYKEYKKTTPFLIPNRASITYGIRTARKNGGQRR